MPHVLLVMLSSPWFWVNILLSVAGGIIVYIGLKTERDGEKMLVPADFHPNIFGDVEEKAKSKIERGWRILMIGIVFEVVAAFGISVISGLEIAVLSGQTASANLAAKRAEVEAAEANERAANVESNNVVLRKGLQARVITDKQISNFIFLTEKLPKIPIRVAVTSRTTPETASYAWQIRRMLNEANFPTPSFDTNSNLGIHFINGMAVPIIKRLIAAQQSEPPDVTLEYNSTNGPEVFHYLAHETNNGFVRFTVSPNDTNSIYGALVNYLTQDGINIALQRSPKWEGTNQYEIFVKERFFIPPPP